MNVQWYGASNIFLKKVKTRTEGGWILTPPDDAESCALTFARFDRASITQDDLSVLSQVRVYIKAASLSTETDITGSAATEANITDSAAKAAFVSYMAETCAKLGMDDSVFANASGLTAASIITPKDELKLAVVIAGNPLAMDIWSTKDRSFDIGGLQKRTVSVVNNVYGAESAESYYKLLGGKGGSLLPAGTGGGHHRKARIAIYEVLGRPVAVALAGPDQWIYKNIVPCAQDVCRLVEANMRGLDVASTTGTSVNFRAEPSTEAEVLQKLSGGTAVLVLEPGETWAKVEADGVVGYISAPLLTSGSANLATLLQDGGGYCAVPVPVCAGAYINAESVAELLMRDYAVHGGEALPQYPASTTKAMTMLCALSSGIDLHSVITLTEDDVTIGGSGSTYYSGDKIFFADAMRIMMMESSNVLAEAIGRFIGTALLRAKIERDGG